MPASIFRATDPYALTRAWLKEAEETEPNDPNAVALATVDGEGLPNVRIVLLKAIEDDGFVFYTNYGSQKGREIEASGKAAFVLHWKTLARQVRVRGTIGREDAEMADAYFASRPLDSRLGAWASVQSQPLESRDVLEDRLAAARNRFGGNPPRPPHWGGFRLSALEFEFWEGLRFRLHDRERWRRDGTDSNWAVQRLFP